MKREDILKSFGKHLKKVRMERGVSLRELSLRMENTDKSMLSKIENGSQNATIVTIYKICEALDINYADLFKDYGKKK